MIKKCGMDGIKSLANMACEVSKYEGLVAISVQGRSFCHDTGVKTPKKTTSL